MAIGTHEGGGCAAVPGVQILAGVEDDLGLWVRADELGCKDGPGGVGDGDRVPNQRVEVGGGKGGVAVQGAEPSMHRNRVSLKTPVDETYLPYPRYAFLRAWTYFLRQSRTHCWQ